VAKYYHLAAQIFYLLSSVKIIEKLLSCFKEIPKQVRYEGNSPHSICWRIWCQYKGV